MLYYINTSWKQSEQNGRKTLDFLFVSYIVKKNMMLGKHDGAIGHDTNEFVCTIFSYQNVQEKQAQFCCNK